MVDFVCGNTQLLRALVLTAADSSCDGSAVASNSDEALETKSGDYPEEAQYSDRSRLVVPVGETPPAEHHSGYSGPPDIIELHNDVFCQDTRAT